MTIKNSSHTDQSDQVLYQQFESMLFNKFSKVNGVKKQGTNIEFHEFLAMLWLDYLLKIGHHNNTYSERNLQIRLKQFRELITYDQRMDKFIGDSRPSATDLSVSKIENVTEMALLQQSDILDSDRENDPHKPRLTF